MPTYLVSFVCCLLDFRYAELDTLVSFLGLDPAAVSLSMQPPNAREINSSHVIITLPSEAHAAAIQRRGILVESVLALWGHGVTFKELEASLALLPSSFLAPYMAADQTWSLIVAGRGTSPSPSSTPSQPTQPTHRFPLHHHQARP